MCCLSCGPSPEQPPLCPWQPCSAGTAPREGTKAHRGFAQHALPRPLHAPAPTSSPNGTSTASRGPLGGLWVPSKLGARRLQRGLEVGEGGGSSMSVPTDAAQQGGGAWGSHPGSFTRPEENSKYLPLEHTHTHSFLRWFLPRSRSGRLLSLLLSPHPSVSSF